MAMVMAAEVAPAETGSWCMDLMVYFYLLSSRPSRLCGEGVFSALRPLRLCGDV
jgi:hypothetical protein